MKNCFGALVFGCFALLSWYEVATQGDTRPTESLRPDGQHVVAVNFSYHVYIAEQFYYTSYSNYETCCKKFIVCTSRCTRYRSQNVAATKSVLTVRYGISYFCETGWLRQGQECTLPVCNPPCENGKCIAPGVCECASGFQGARCSEEIDECTTLKPCQQRCANLHGGNRYHCSCIKGYIQDPKNSSLCLDVDECKVAQDTMSPLCQCVPQNVMCKAECLNTPGSYQCKCSPGFNLRMDKICSDADECRSGSHGCQQMCLNTFGGFECACYKGFSLNPDKRTCQDIDECALKGVCEQICTNSRGSYECSCRSGYRLKLDQETCEDLDECSLSRPCDPYHGKCVNVEGSYQCGCERGYELSSHGIACQDENECDKPRIHQCEHLCRNTDGSFICQCSMGYQLRYDGKSCGDVDECTSNLHNCEQLCFNLPGSFSCGCRDGYLLHSDERSCKALPCKTLMEPHHGSMKCTGRNVGDRCQMQCDVGYELVGVGQKECLSGSLWSSGETKCAPVKCPDATPPVQGALILPCQEEYGEECLVKCLSGYQLQGEAKMSCLFKDGVTYWDTNTNCTEINICRPDPCQHKGKCLALSHKKYECNCAGTGYVGPLCERGLIILPKYPQLLVNVTSDLLEIKANPEKELIIHLASDDNVTIFEPNQLHFYPVKNTAEFRVTPKQIGVVKIQYIVSGTNQLDFITPADGIFLAISQNPAMHLSRLPGPDFMASNCLKLSLTTCGSEADVVSLISSCPWKVSGTSGYVAVSAGLLNLPFSLGGIKFLASEGLSSVWRAGVLSVTRETQEVLKNGLNTYATCGECSGSGFTDADHQFALRRNLFLRAYHQGLSLLMPWWMRLTLPDDYNGFHVNDIQSLVLKADRMSDLNICQSLPSEFEGTYSVVITKAPMQLTIMTKTLTVDSPYFSCAVASLCGQAAYVSLPVDTALNFADDLAAMKIKMLNVVFGGVGVSPSKEIYRSCILAWNGLTKHDMNLCVAAKAWAKGTVSLGLPDSSATFKGELFIDSSDLDKIALDRFTAEQRVLLRGAVSGTISVRVAGKKLNFIIDDDSTSLFATLGGSSEGCLPCGRHGVHMWLGNDKVEIDYETAALKVYPKDLQTKPTNLQVHFYYDLSSGSVVSVESARRLLMTITAVERKLSLLVQGIVGKLNAVRYKLEIANLKSTIEAWGTDLKAAMQLLGVADAKYDLVYKAISKFKVTAGTVYDALAALRDALSVAEQSPVESHLRNLRLTLQSLSKLTLEAKLANVQERYHGLSISFNGKLCIYSLCFDNSIHSIYDMRLNAEENSRCDGCWSPGNVDRSNGLLIYSTSQAERKLGPFVTVKAGTQIYIWMSNTDDKFEITMPASVTVFGQEFNVDVKVTPSMLSYTIPDVEISRDIFFDINASANFTFTTTWMSIRFAYTGVAKLDSKLSSEVKSLAVNLVSSIVKKANDRTSKADVDFADASKAVEKYEKEVSLLVSEFEKARDDQRDASSMYLRAVSQFNATRFNFRSNMVGSHLKQLQQLLDDACKIEQCKDTCQSYDLWEICQEDVVAYVNELKCLKIKRDVRTTVEEPVKSDCDMTNVNFIPIYTGTCSKGDQQALKGSLIGVGAGAGSLIGLAVGGPAGAAVGGIIGTAVGAFATLFSSCDESYEVIKEVVNYQVPCSHKVFNTHKAVLEVTECDVNQVVVHGGFGEPKPCPAINSTCIPVQDPQCMLDNIVCLRQHDVITKQQLEKAGKFNESWAKLNELDVVQQQKFAEKQNADYKFREISRKYDRATAFLHESRVALRMAQTSKENINQLLGTAKCNYNYSAFDIGQITFDTDTPVTENLLFNVPVQSDTSLADRSFLFVFADRDLSIEQGVRKIVMSHFCNAKERRRRSVVEEISRHALGRHDDAPEGVDVTEAETTCLSSRTVFAYVTNITGRLKSAATGGVHRSTELRKSLTAVVSYLAQVTKEQRQSSVVLQQVATMETLKADLEAELTELSGPSLLFKWRQTMEVYTGAHNFSTCLNLKDCIDVALESLNELPTMGVSRSDFSKQVKQLQQDFIVLFQASTLQDLVHVATVLEASLAAMQTAVNFCARPPQVRLSSGAQVTEPYGQIIELQCIVSSALPVSYLWQHDGVALPSESSPKLRIYVQPSAVGKYQCVAWNRAGRNVSEETYLILQKTPVFIGEPEDFSYVDTVAKRIKPNFECNVTSDSPVTIHWYFEPFNQTGVAIKLHYTKPALRIGNVTAENSGFYYCKATNKYGTVTSRRARLDVLAGLVPRQEVSAAFDLVVDRSENTDKQAYVNKVGQDAALGDTQSVKLSVEPAGLKQLKLEVRISDNLDQSIDATTVSDNSLLRKVSQARASLNNGVQRVVSGLAVDSRTAVEMERTLILGFDGDRCQSGARLHENGFTCVECPAGTFEFVRKCRLCPIGKFQPRSGQTSCIPCAPEEVTSEKGARSIDACVAPRLSSTDLVFAIDTSGVLLPDDFEKVKQLVSDFVNNYVELNVKVLIGLIAFGATAKEIVVLGAHPRSSVLDAISRMTYMKGDTRTDLALELALSMFERSPMHGQQRSLIVISDGPSTDESTLSGFTLVRRASTRLSKARVHVLSIGVGGLVDQVELMTMASTPKSSNTIQVPSFDGLVATNQIIAAATLKGRCGIKSKDILVAIESSASVTDGHWREVQAFVTDFVTRQRELPENNFAFMSFGSSLTFVGNYRKFDTDLDVQNLVSKIPILKGRVDLPKALSASYNWYITERHGGLSDVKVILLVSRYRVQEEVFGLLQRHYQDETVRLINVVMTLELTEEENAQLALEETFRTVYTLSELTEVVKRVKNFGKSEYETC